jgi:cathepsin L
MKNPLYRYRLYRVLLGALFLTVLALAPRAEPADPCCQITAINEHTGLVTARETATSRTFEFHVPDAKLLTTLKVGQGVYANFATKQVSHDGVTACCEIRSLSGAGALPMPLPAPGLQGVSPPPGPHSPELALSPVYAEREKTAPPAVKQKLADLRVKIQKEKLAYSVGYTGVADRPLASLTGLKLPADWRARASEQNTLAGKVLQLEQQAIQDAVALGLIGDPEVSLQASLPPVTASAFDWTRLGKVSPVRDQSLCGSCWDFAAVAAMESSILIRYNDAIQLSPQYALDNAIVGSCNGGFPGEVWTDMVVLGTAKESDVPYLATKRGPLLRFDNPYRALIWGFVGNVISPPTISELKAALLRHGPLAITMYVGPDGFQYHAGGVYNLNSVGDTNHVVTLVGWDDTKGAWRIKNSWGPYWGESDGPYAGGFAWVAYGVSEIGKQAFWVRALNVNLKLPRELLDWLEKAQKLGTQARQEEATAEKAVKQEEHKVGEAVSSAERRLPHCC